MALFTMKKTPTALEFNIEHQICKDSDLIEITWQGDKFCTFTQAWGVGKKLEQTLYHCHLCHKETFNSNKAAMHAMEETMLLGKMEEQERTKKQTEALLSIQKYLISVKIDPSILVTKFGAPSEVPLPNE